MGLIGEKFLSTALYGSNLPPPSFIMSWHSPVTLCTTCILVCVVTFPLPLKTYQFSVTNKKNLPLVKQTLSYSSFKLLMVWFPSWEQVSGFIAAFQQILLKRSALNMCKIASLCINVNMCFSSEIMNFFRLILFLISICSLQSAIKDF